MTVEQIEIRKILNQMLADNGINRETIKDIIKDCIDERVDKALKHFENKSDGYFANMDDRIQEGLDRLVKREIEIQAKEAVRAKVGYFFNNITVNVELNPPTEKGGEE
ncbi:MAG: hypothetical protein IJW79_09125 [Clostridia bacterium]|nr:hypothetical protein [Clostridia bacterium]